MRNNVAEILNSFEPISLKEMDGVELLNRIDTKYVFCIDKLPEFLESIADQYRVLEVANTRLNRYETLYYDTDDYSLYLQHHNGKQNRYKVRYRCYTDSASSYFEIKFKSNKDRTYKSRIKAKSIENSITDEAETFLKKKTPLDAAVLSAKLWVYYTRITLVSNCQKERVTIDIDIAFKNQTNAVKYPRLVIAEVKQDKACPSSFLALMKTNHIRTDSISKYCFGVISMNENIKKNNFKFNLLSINKTCHE